MTIDPRTPVIVGAGQMLHHDVPGEKPCEPVALIAEALRRAGEDSGTGERLLCRADSVRCVPVVGWHYRDAATLVAEDLRAQPRETVQSAAIGGDGPQLLLNDTACAIDEVAHVDLYSCFPAAVQIAARELGLAIDDPARPLTVTGGLTFAGGPGNNYSAHAIATLVHLLRRDSDAYGLATAMGWYLTKHAAGIYSARPPRQPFASLNSQPQRPPARRARTDYTGPATIEAYTVVYQRDGDPDAAIVSALTPDHDRALIRTPDRDIVDAILSNDPIGWSIGIAADQSLTIEDPTPRPPTAEHA